MPVSTAPLTPRNPNGELLVVAIGRISTVHQDHESIEASYRYIQEFLSHIYRGPIQMKLLGEQASGMLTDRATIRAAEDLVATGTVDLVIAEDLARIYRNPRHQYSFVQDCVDRGTRLICVGDNLDTADDNWEIAMGAAALRHGLHIPDTRRRVRRSATHSFHNGGMVQKVKYGYRKLSAEEAASGESGTKGLRIAKVYECTPVILQMMKRVMAGAAYAAVADWLNAEGIRPGHYVRSGRWTARLVVDLLDDPILGGMRTFRKTVYRPVFRTGKHHPTRNDDPETEHYLELAHLSQEEHDSLREEIARRRAAHNSKNGESRPRPHYLPRSRTIWPGQCITCGVCGGLFHYMGRHLRCCNSLPNGHSTCWNHVQVPAELTRARVIDWLAKRLDEIPDGRNVLAAAVWRLMEPAKSGQQRQTHELAREIASLEKQAANLTTAIAEGGQLKTLIQHLQSVEKSLQKARRSKAVQESSAKKDRHGIGSADDLAECLEEHLSLLIGRKHESTDLMRQILPEFTIRPVQALDTYQVRPRAKFTLRLAALREKDHTDDCQASGLPDVPGSLDLFEPPLHIRYLDACVTAKQHNPKLSLKQIAALLGICHMTVKRALDYSRRMRSEGLNDPYRELYDPPQEASRWRR